MSPKMHDDRRQYQNLATPVDRQLMGFGPRKSFFRQDRIPKLRIQHQHGLWIQNSFLRSRAIRKLTWHLELVRTQIDSYSYFQVSRLGMLWSWTWMVACVFFSISSKSFSRGCPDQILWRAMEELNSLWGRMTTGKKRRESKWVWNSTSVLATQ